MKQKIALVLAVIVMLIAGFGMAEERGSVIPEIVTKQMKIPENEALSLIRDMKAGWNLGNTFDAIDCNWLKDPLDYESGWCGVKTSEKLIEALLAAGFRTIRIPASWHNHLDKDWTIDPAWLARIKEVARWAYDRGMYVIVNIHHDCDPAYYYPDEAHAANSEKYMRTIWSQLAETFRDWGDHLILESINEPRLKDTDHEWWWEP
ncbi:MAG: cellulase family glycosylhydrolase, partial [Firmicutes bacterium]|nr:cellulase family glycosylhydrolase [Bacillota bacterium]